MSGDKAPESSTKFDPNRLSPEEIEENARAAAAARATRPELIPDPPAPKFKAPPMPTEAKPPPPMRSPKNDASGSETKPEYVSLDPYRPTPWEVAQATH